MLFSKTRVLIKDMQMSSETGIQDVCVLIKDMQMSSETGIQDVCVLIEDMQMSSETGIYNVLEQKLQSLFWSR